MSAPEDRDARARRRKLNFRKRHHAPPHDGPSRRARQHDPWCDDYTGEHHTDYEEEFKPLDFHDGEEEDDE